MKSGGWIDEKRENLAAQDLDSIVMLNWGQFLDNHSSFSDFRYGLLLTQAAIIIIN